MHHPLSHCALQRDIYRHVCVTSAQHFPIQLFINLSSLPEYDIVATEMRTEIDLLQPSPTGNVPRRQAPSSVCGHRRRQEVDVDSWSRLRHQGDYSGSRPVTVAPSANHLPCPIVVVNIVYRLLGRLKGSQVYQISDLIVQLITIQPVTYSIIICHIMQPINHLPKYIDQSPASMSSYTSKHPNIIHPITNLLQPITCPNVILSSTNHMPKCHIILNQSHAQMSYYPQPITCPNVILSSTNHMPKCHIILNQSHAQMSYYPQPITCPNVILSSTNHMPKCHIILNQSHAQMSYYPQPITCPNVISSTNHMPKCHIILNQSHAQMSYYPQPITCPNVILSSTNHMPKCHIILNQSPAQMSYYPQPITCPNVILSSTNHMPKCHIILNQSPAQISYL